MWWLFVEDPDRNPFAVTRQMRVLVVILLVLTAVSWSVLWRGRQAYRDLRTLVIERCR